MMPGQAPHQPPLPAAHQRLAGPSAEHGGLDDHEDIWTRQFSTTRLRPGYDEQEVDAFLDEVDAELDRLRHDNRELERKLARTRRNARGADTVLSAGDSPADGEAAAGHYPATGIRALAQHVADQAIAAARRDAADTIAHARHQADQITQTAAQTAGQAISDATARAESLERDSQERHRQAIGSLGPRRAELQARVDYLSAFERDYRAKLKARLKSHLRDVEASADDSTDIPASAATGPHPATGPGMDDVDHEPADRDDVGGPGRHVRHR